MNGCDLERKEVAGYYGLPVLDLYSISGMLPKVDVVKEIICLMDYILLIKGQGG